jgi:uncharacterized protein (TIGR03435 family)
MKFHLAITTTIAAGTVLAAVPLMSQTSTVRPSFEVASVKPGDATNPSVGVHVQPGGRFTTTNTALKMLIQYAYEVPNNQILGGPGWIDSDRYTIEAKAPATTDIPNMTDPQKIDMAALQKMISDIRLMVQSLLADRFKLAVHWETREAPVYNLVIVKGGHKMKESGSSSNDLNGGRGQLTAVGVPLSQLIHSLSQQLERPIIDKTGLVGKYDFTLKYTPEASVR